MPKISIGPLGTSGGHAGTNDGNAGVRGIVKGWSPSSARANAKFLRSVDASQLPEIGYAFTFTVGGNPTPQDWVKLRKAIIQVITRKLGAVCWHLVTEWTAAGRPHLHGCCFFLDFDKGVGTLLKQKWLEVSSQHGSGPRGQLVKPIDGPAGWFVYSGKHCSRGMGHYQRQFETLPPEWRGNTGRVWGKGGRWPTVVEENEVTSHQFYRFRRCCDAYDLADARTQLKRAFALADARKIKAAKRRIVFLRKMRKTFGKGRKASEVRGVSNWIPGETSKAILRLVGGDDHEISDDIHSALERHGLSVSDVPF